MILSYLLHKFSCDITTVITLDPYQIKELSLTSHLSHTSRMHISKVVNQCMGGEIGLFITLVPKILQQRFLICWLNNFVDFYWISFGWFIKLSVQTIPPLILMYRKGILVFTIIKLKPVFLPGISELKKLALIWLLHIVM